MIRNYTDNDNSNRDDNDDDVINNGSNDDNGDILIILTARTIVKIVIQEKIMKNREIRTRWCLQNLVNCNVELFLHSSESKLEWQIIYFLLLV